MTKHVLLFSGHMIDTPSRKNPRFPETCEDSAREALQNVLAAEVELSRTLGEQAPQMIGISGGACGGDILFQEACIHAGITPHMYLVYPKDLFIATSVSFAGQSWVKRFNQLYATLDKQGHVYTQDSRTTIPFSSTSAVSIWERNNEWMLRNAFALNGIRTTIIALWNREGAHRPGGTADMINQAHEHGAESVVLDPNELC